MKTRVHKNSIYNVVNGKNRVEVSTLNKICLDLGINLYKFFSYQSNQFKDFSSVANYKDFYSFKRDAYNDAFGVKRDQIIV